MDEKLTQFSAAHLPSLEETMYTFLSEESNEARLTESMIYSLKAGGKRLRPLLVLATLDFCGQKIQPGHYQVAGALEMIHTYSLIHDDLPAMDDDELRRGKPTNHVVFGEALAILAGDGLLTAAFQLASQADLPSEIRLTLVTKLAQAAGNRGMIGGQVADIAGEGQRLELSSLEFVHQRKTGALIEFAVEAGGRLSGQSEEVILKLREFARHFGIAFQIKDDLLDVLGDEATIGKKTGMDATLDKSTYTSLLGVAGANEALEGQVNLALSALKEVAPLVNGDVKNSLLHALLATLTVADERRES